MTSMINPETFEVSEQQPEHGYFVKGTVEVTIRNETRRLPAYCNGDKITAMGLNGRYMTGTVDWAATITRVIDPRNGRPWDQISFGRDDRSGKFNKRNMIFFKD